MGVQDKEMYPQIKQLLGIPEDEPIFILRGQDDRALRTIEQYYVLQTIDRDGTDVQEEEFLTGLLAVREDFWFFSKEDPARMKKAD